MGAPARKGKKVAAAPGGGKKTTEATSSNPLFDKRPRNFGIGCAIMPKRNLSRYVRWPKYIRFQREKAVLLQRLKVPPAINQFRLTAEKNLATQVFGLLDKYRPEDKAQKKLRLQSMAEAKAVGKTVEGNKPVVVKYGLNHVTALIEEKKAKLVVIASDVVPLEIVIFLPALCKKMEIPYVIIKDKSRLGTVVGKKTATCLAIVDVKPEDRAALTKIAESAVVNFNDKYTDRMKRWGGQVNGIKSTTRAAKHAAIASREAMARAGIRG